MKRLFIAIALALVLTVGGFTAAFAAPSPNGPGQPGAPGVSCGSGNATAQPPGFGTAGFTLATSVYAGSPGTPSAANANSPHAVSQYDIACFQQTVNH